MPQALPISQQKALTITYKMETDTNPRGIALGFLTRSSLCFGQLYFTRFTELALRQERRELAPPRAPSQKTPSQKTPSARTPGESPPERDEFE